MDPIKVILKPEVVMNNQNKKKKKYKSKQSIQSVIIQNTIIKKCEPIKLDNEIKIDYTMTDEDFYSLLENILHYIDNSCIQYISYPNYETRVEDEIWNYLYIILPDDAIDDNKDILESLVNYSIEHYFTIMCKERSFNRELFFEIQTEKEMEIIHKKLDVIINLPQPEQKSKEWYTYRHKLITASSAWKILDSISNQNQYIYSKCTPLCLEKYNRVSLNSPFHWGNKYEPLSVMLYEYLYNTKVGDFGCLPHPKYKFLGASPDGINIDKTNNELYGRMLEIKNIFNREINGIPKREYWIQMQLQMEVCDLDYCDFLECRFKEYEDQESFEEDGTFQKTKKNQIKGIKLMFFKDNKPHYEYAPFLCSKETYEKWHENTIKEAEIQENCNYIKTIYWWLEEYSCVLVERNKNWFYSVVDDFETIYNIIQTEKVTGYEHRKPKSRTKKSTLENTKNTKNTKQTTFPEIIVTKSMVSSIFEDNHEEDYLQTNQ